MHENEAAIDAGLVRGLITAQFPRWADLPLRSVPSSGTMNAIFRLGDELAVQMPRIPEAADLVAKKHRLLPALAPRLPVAIPVPVGLGAPAEGYPWPWSVQRWLAGEVAVSARAIDYDRLAVDLAAFITALHGFAGLGKAPVGRGVRLAPRDTVTREAIGVLGGLYDVPLLLALWHESLHAPPWERPPVWSHGDLIPTNLLVRAGRLVGVIDYDTLGLADPAWDVVPAWSVFPAGARAAFRQALGVDEATWLRARGLALSQAALIIPYYEHTNPVLVSVATRMIDAILADVE